MAPLGSLLASLLGPLGRPNRPKSGPRGPKIAPRRPKMASRPAKMIIFMQNRDFSKIVKILRKINGFCSPSPPKIAPRWPQARSRWPKIGPRRLQDVSKTVLKGICSLLQIAFDFESFSDRFWLHFGSQNASLLAPFWRSKSIKKSIRNRTALKVAPRSPQERPRPSQDAPRTPPESPRTPQEASWTPPGCPKKLSGPPRTTQNVFRSIWPNNLFRKNRKIRTRRKR